MRMYTGEEMPLSIPVKVGGTRDEAEVACEHVINVFVNGRRAMRLVCTPQYLDELVAGRLLTEGLIDVKDDIEDLSIDENGAEARVRVLPKRAGSGKKETGDIIWDRAWFDIIFKRLREGEPLFNRTHATHACYFAKEDQVLCCREDIGRHNALDKAVGYGMLNGEDLSKCYLFTTGRIPTDMINKAVNAGIPLMVSKTFPTHEAIEIANRESITLITVREDGSVLIWSGNKEEYKWTK